MFAGIFKVGDRVEVTGKRPAPLKHRKKVIGRITHIDGAYIYVRPNWCKWEQECYPNELKKLNK